MSSDNLAIRTQIEEAKKEIKNNQFVKIWFPGPGTHPLGGFLNEFRLSIHKVRFPGDTIHLITNLEDLNDAERNQLVQFCEKHEIHLKDLETIRKELEDSKEIADQKIQLELLSIAKAEIKDELGCLALVSDIVRALTPVAILGCYTDFDIIKLKACSIPQDQWGSSIGLSLMGQFSFEKNDDIRIGLINNNAFVCNESKSSFLKEYRAQILHNYKNLKEIIERLVREKRLIASEYKAANEADKLKPVKKGLALPIKLRHVLKPTLSQTNYLVFLEYYVSSVSGPDCMMKTLESYFSKNIAPAFKKMVNTKKLPQDAFLYEKLKALNYTLRLPLELEGCLANEEDISWLPAYDTRKERWENMEAAAKKIQAVFRKYLKTKS